MAGTQRPAGNWQSQKLPLRHSASRTQPYSQARAPAIMGGGGSQCPFGAAVQSASTLHEGKPGGAPAARGAEHVTPARGRLG